MARPVVGNPFDGQIGTVAPTARPVDTYVRGVVKSSPFEALSNTLSNLEKKAIPALQREQARRAEAEYAQGQELYNKTRVSIGDAVRDGIIAEGESPYIRKGYRVANIKNLSTDYAVQLQREMTKKQLYKSSDPEAVKSYFNEFDASFRENNGFDGFNVREVSEFFTPTQISANNAAMKSWSKQNSAWVTKQAYASVENSIAKVILGLDMNNPNATIEQNAAKTVAARAAIQDAAQQAEIDGLDRSKVSTMIANAVIGTAELNSDSSYLQILDGVKIGTGSFSDILKFKTKIEDAKYTINNRNYQMDERNHKLQERATEEQTVATYGQGFDILYGDDEGKPRDYEQIDSIVESLQSLGTAKSLKFAKELRAAADVAQFKDFNPIERFDDERAMALVDRTTFLSGENLELQDVNNFLLNQVQEGYLEVDQMAPIIQTWRNGTRASSQELWGDDKAVNDFYDGSWTALVKIEEIGLYGQAIGAQAITIELDTKERFRALYEQFKIEQPLLPKTKIARKVFDQIMLENVAVNKDEGGVDPEARNLTEPTNGLFKRAKDWWFDSTDP